MLLANLLLALAWAALQGEFSVPALLTGHVIGYLILLALCRGGNEAVASASRACRLYCAHASGPTYT